MGGLLRDGALGVLEMPCCSPTGARFLSATVQAGLKSQLEARLAAVSERVGALAQREAKQEKKRGGWCMLRLPSIGVRVGDTQQQVTEQQATFLTVLHSCCP